MANTLFRLLLHMRKDPKLNRLINSIDKKFPSYELGAQTPLPNQTLDTATLANGKPVCLYFSDSASSKLEAIRDLAQSKYLYRHQHGKEDKSIDFICTGYQDRTGDIVISDIEIPGLEVYREQNLDLYDALYNNRMQKDVNIATQSDCFEYLRTTSFNEEQPIGYMPVALMGTTRPIVATNDNTEYCPKFNELSKAIMPANVTIDHPIMSGILSISPKYHLQSPNGEQTLTNGSLECVLITYKQNQNQTVTPDKFLNITRCQETLKDGSFRLMDISKSNQPLKDLPILSEVKVK